MSYPDNGITELKFDSSGLDDKYLVNVANLLSSIEFKNQTRTGIIQDTNKLISVKISQVRKKYAYCRYIP